MTSTTTTLGVCVLAATLTAAHPAAARAVEIRITGEHRVVVADTPESARQLAIVDARRKALQAAVARLLQRADVKALRLTPRQLEAFAAVLVDVDEPPPATASLGSAVRLTLRAMLDADAAAGLMAGLQKDQDVTHELVGTWTRTQQLHRELDDRTRRRATASNDAAGAILQEQLQIVRRLAVMQLTARGHAALARTAPATVGGRAIPPEGRERARQLADAALTLSPGSPDAHYLLGDLLVEEEQPEAAEAAYRAALKGEPASSAGHTRLAAALRFQGKLPEAVAELKEAQRIDPAYARAHSDMGMILRAERKIPDAIAAYREAVRLDPESTDAHNGLAVALANSGRLEEAVAEFREIVRIDPDSTIGYYNLAYALADLDKDIESAAALREVIRINPDHYNARYNLGELFRLEEKFDDSATQFREYLRLAPDTPQNRRNISRASGFIRQFEDPDAPPVADAMMPRQQR